MPSIPAEYKALCDSITVIQKDEKPPSKQTVLSEMKILLTSRMHERLYTRWHQFNTNLNAIFNSSDTKILDTAIRLQKALTIREKRQAFQQQYTAQWTVIHNTLAHNMIHLHERVVFFSSAIIQFFALCISMACLALGETESAKTAFGFTCIFMFSAVAAHNRDFQDARASLRENATELEKINTDIQTLKQDLRKALEKTPSITSTTVYSSPLAAGYDTSKTTGWRPSLSA